jgi:hypothetical protein
VKSVEISGKKREYMKGKINELKNIGHVHRNLNLKLFDNGVLLK